MIIYDKTGKQILDVPADDNSYRYRAIKQGDKVFLYFSLTEHVEIPLHSYVDYQGQRYILSKPENLTKHYSRNIEYSVEFWGWWELLYRTKYKLLSEKPHKLKFSLTASPYTFMQLMIDNLNLHDSGWKLGTCIEATEKLLSFSHEDCMSVLNRFCDEFNTEFEFEGKTIHFCKVEKFKDSPIPLSYGRGKGFKSGVGRTYQGDSSPVTVLYVQGGERNIDRTKYNSPTLLLPKNQELEYQGRRYKTDPDGMYITRVEDLVTFNEDSYDASNIYPSRVGDVTGVETEASTDSEGKPVTFYNIIDTTIPEALNYRDCRLDGNKATIIFQSGKLAGREFDIMQSKDDLTGYDHATRTFKLVSMQEDGMNLPNEHLCPSVGDKYAVFNISLPEAYVCDNATKSGASWDMFREAAQYMYENEDNPFTFKGDLDSIHAKRHWLEIGGKLLPGGYVLFSDEQFQKEGINIRITGVKDYINKPYSPELELSNTPVSGLVSSDLGKIDANEVTDADKHKQSIQYTKRRFRDAQETMTMLADALLTNFTESINPIAVATMQMLVGDESLQFRFVNSKTNPTVINLNVAYNEKSKILSVPATILQHMTLGIKEISSTHKYKFWDMGSYASPPLVDAEKKYYLYAKCSKNNETGTFRVSDKAIALEGEAGYYHFLVGVLNSEYDGERSYVSLYGFTEVLPGRVTADKMVSSDGNNFMDFLNNAFRVGDNKNYLDWNTKKDGKLRLKGTLIQSESGDESPVGCFRGIYNSETTYYLGDEITYTNNGGTSTYKWIYATPGKGILPTDTSRWTLVASQGTDGSYYENRYAVNGSRTEAPALDKNSPTPSGWTTGLPNVSSLQYLWYTVAKKSASGSLLTNWSTPVRMTSYDGIDGKNGADGKNGEVGPALTFQGDYNSAKKYYGTSKRVDATKYNGIYYVARVDAGDGFSGKVPTDTNFWNGFGNQFDNVATDLLLAEKAYIKNLGVSSLRTSTGSQRIEINEENNAMEFYYNDNLAISISTNYFDGAYRPCISLPNSDPYGVSANLTPEGLYFTGMRILQYIAWTADRGLRINLGLPYSTSANLNSGDWYVDGNKYVRIK